MFPFSIWRDGVSSPELSREVVAEAGLGAGSSGSAVAGQFWEYFRGTPWRD